MRDGRKQPSLGSPHLGERKWGRGLPWCPGGRREGALAELGYWFKTKSFNKFEMETNALAVGGDWLPEMEGRRRSFPGDTV